MVGLLNNPSAPPGLPCQYSTLETSVMATEVAAKAWNPGRKKKFEVKGARRALDIAEIRGVSCFHSPPLWIRDLRFPHQILIGIIYFFISLPISCVADSALLFFQAYEELGYSRKLILYIIHMILRPML